MFTTRLLLATVLFVGLMTAVGAAGAATDTDDFKRGYLQGLLESRFPGLGLNVRAVGPQQVTLGARACLGATQKRDIERAITEIGRVPTVAWDAVADCEQRPETGAGVDVQPLPERELFAPLIADPRQPRFSMSYQRYRTPSDSFNAASVALGEQFGFASGFLGDSGASQLGIQAGVFALFNLDADSEDLINADYWIGFPLSYRRGSWSYLLQLYHQSSHLGDEFILGNPGINRINLSYEGVEFLTSHEWERLRLYGGGGYIVSSESDLKPWSGHAGAEYVQPKAIGGFDFIVAYDARLSQEIGWLHSRSYLVGFEFQRGAQRRVRLMLEHFRGHSPNGQFYSDKLRYTGAGLYFGF